MKQIIQICLLSSFYVYLLASQLTAYAQPVINTVAGTGAAGYRGDGGPATGAELNYPYTVATDGSSNLYIADYSNHVIRRVDKATGIITTVAGNGTSGYSGDGGLATAARLSYPNSVAVDGAGNLYIADEANERIRRVDKATGLITTVAGTGDWGYSGDGGPATAAQFNSPYGITLDGSGNIYFADYGNYCFRRIDKATGIITTVAGNGTMGYSGDGGPATEAQFDNVTGIRVDGAGNLFLVDYKNHAIRRVDKATEIITTVAGDGSAGYQGDGGAAVDAELSYPSSIAIDKAGNLYIAELGNQSVRRIDNASGVITTVAGNGTSGYRGDGGPAKDAQLASPSGLAFDDEGRLYIAQIGDNRVRSISFCPGLQAGLTASNEGKLSCLTKQVLLTFSGAGAYTLVGPQGTIALDANATSVSVEQAGAYRLTVTSGGCSNTASVTVTGAVNGPGATLTASNNGQLSCANPVVTLLASDGANYIFSGPGLTQAGTSPSATVSTAGLYSVTVTAATGCTATAQTTVTGNATPPPAAPDLSAGGQTSLTVTQGSPAVMLSAPNCSGTLTWSNDTDSGTGAITVSTQTTGTFVYHATCRQGDCKSPEATATVVVLAPAAQLSVSSLDGDNNQPANNLIRPYFQVNNEGSTAIPYSEITVRYWFTAENFAPLTNLQLNWAKMGTEKVKLQYVSLPADQPRQGAFGYVEYRFDASAGVLAAGSNSGAVFSQLAKQDWTVFDETDDYSYLNAGNFTKNNHITVYRNGVLVGGQEPAPVAPVQSLNVLSENRNGAASTYLLSTSVQVVNAGNVPVAYSDLKVRYWFTSELAANQALKFYLDGAKQLGNQVQGQFGTVSRQGADTYLELSFGAALGNLPALSNSGNLYYRIGKSGGGVGFDQSNDYSYQPAGILTAAPRLTLYVGNTLVWGTEPSASTSARLSAESPAATLHVSVLNNPLRDGEVTLEVRGAERQPLELQVFDLQGRLVAKQQVSEAGVVERHSLSVGSQAAGELLLRVSTPTQNQTVRLLKAE